LRSIVTAEDTTPWPGNLALTRKQIETSVNEIEKSQFYKNSKTNFSVQGRLQLALRAEQIEKQHPGLLRATSNLFEHQIESFFLTIEGKYGRAVADDLRKWAFDLYGPPREEPKRGKPKGSQNPIQDEVLLRLWLKVRDTGKTLEQFAAGFDSQEGRGVLGVSSVDQIRRRLKYIRKRAREAEVKGTQ
jgi:hypothetical protein